MLLDAMDAINARVDGVQQFTDSVEEVAQIFNSAILITLPYRRLQVQRVRRTNHILTKLVLMYIHTSMSTS
jgi:hypothetical protein